MLTCAFREVFWVFEGSVRECFGNLGVRIELFADVELFIRPLGGSDGL